MKKALLGITAVAAIAVLFWLVYFSAYFLRIGIVTEGPMISQGQPDKPALLVIDIQEGITGKSAPAMTKKMARQSGPFIEKVNQAINKAQALKMPVIYIRQESTDKIFNFLANQLLAEGHPSAALDPRVQVVEGPVFIKHMMDTFTNPEFESYLKQNGVNHLYVTGLDATACVDRTIRGALKRGYAVTAISDAILTDAVAKREKMCRQWAGEKVNVMNADQWQ